VQDETKEAHDDNDDEDDENEEIGVNDCCLTNLLTGCRSSLSQFYSRNKSRIRHIVVTVLVVLYFIYFFAAMYYKFGDEGSIRLLWVTCLVVAILILSWIRRLLRPQLQQLTSSKAVKFLRRHHRRLNWFVLYMFLQHTM